MINIKSQSPRANDDDNCVLRRLKTSTRLEAWLWSLADVNTVYEDGMTPLLELLSLCSELNSKVDIFKFRQCLEL